MCHSSILWYTSRFWQHREVIYISQKGEIQPGYPPRVGLGGDSWRMCVCENNASATRIRLYAWKYIPNIHWKFHYTRENMCEIFTENSIIRMKIYTKYSRKIRLYAWKCIPNIHWKFHYTRENICEIFTENSIIRMKIYAKYSRKIQLYAWKYIRAIRGKFYYTCENICEIFTENSMIRCRPTYFVI
jgi:hypothetical protein